MMKFIRGDSCPFKIKLQYKDELKNPVQLNDIDTLFVTCKTNSASNSFILFQKTLNDVEIDSEGYCHIVFEPKDTEKLAYGKYVFDIEVTLKNGYRKTYYDSFEITNETTTHEGK